MIRNVGFTTLVMLMISFMFPIIQTMATSPHVEVKHDPDQVYMNLKLDNRVIEDRTYIPPEVPTVYLTFDDGPSELTPLVLDILREEDVKASFFVLGQLAENRPEVIQRIVNEGHGLGNHTYNHEYKHIYAHFDHFWDQIRHTEDILQRIVSIRPTIIRAPGGTYTNFDAFYYYYLEQAGYTIHDWNVDSGDSKRRGVPAEEIIQNVTNSPLKHELNVLLHDGSGHEESVKALPEIIRYFKNKGYRFATLNEHVKPIQFPVTQNKWGRIVSEQEHKTFMQRLEEQIQWSQEKEERFIYQNVIAIAESSAVLEMGNRISKKKTNNNFEDKRAVSYDERKGSVPLNVPLRAMIERWGGYVAWDEEERKATVRYHTKQVEYYIDTQIMKVFSPNPLVNKTIAQAPFSVEDGSIYVSIHDFEQLLTMHDV